MSINQYARKNKAACAACVVLLLGVLASGCQNTGGYGGPGGSPMSKPDTIPRIKAPEDSEDADEEGMIEVEPDLVSSQTVPLTWNIARGQNSPP